MNKHTVRLGLHSFSFENHFRYKTGFDAFAFIREAERLGLSGVHISMNDERYRWVGGTSPERLRAVGAAARECGMYMETDTSGTDPVHLVKMLRACRLLGADRLRTYTRHKGRPEEQVETAIRDLREAAPVAADLGVSILLENHEDFTGHEIRQILEAVDHPSVGALFDFGNSMMVLEDPLEAAKEMAPFVRSVHLKDHVVVLPPHGRSSNPSAAPLICGAPIGRGRIDIDGVLAYLLENTALNRVCIQSVYGFSAPITRHVERFAEVSGRYPAFVPLEPPWDESICLLDSAALAESDPVRLLSYELSAVASGTGKVREILGRLGFGPADTGNDAAFVKSRAEPGS